MADHKLTKYEESLVQAMLTAKSQREAYKMSLYKSDKMSDAAIDVQVCRILAKPNVSLRLEELQDKLVKRAEEKALVTAEDVLMSILDIRDTCAKKVAIKDKEGNVIAEGHIDTNGALKANELLGKHLKLFTDKVEHSGAVPVQMIDDIE